MQNETLLQAIKYLLSFIGWIMVGSGSLLVFIGSLIAYIFVQHKNDTRECFNQNREDHRRIDQRIDEIMR